MLGMPVGPRPKAVATAQPTPAQPVYAAQTQQAVPTIQGIIVPGSTLAEKLAWLQRSADSHNTYILEMTADEIIVPYTFEYRGAINITIVLRGVEGNRTIRLKSHGNMFEVKENVTFVLDNNITLQGHSGNTGRMIYVNKGTFKMNAGSAIIGNASGGVYNSEGTFTMSGGTISGNNAKEGGGVYNLSTFTMSGGTISGNNASEGGGVYSDGRYYKYGTFTMSDGNIFGNNANDKGGGVYVRSSTFAMRGGIITSNSAVNYGGGVYCGHSGTLKKTAGTITGYNSDPTNGNLVKDETGNIIARRGHAVYSQYGWGHRDERKETTAGVGVNLSSNDGSGAWDQ